MRYAKITPIDLLKPYVHYFVISENSLENTYRVFPSTGLVMGFQYEGRLQTGKEGKGITLATAGITGITDQVRIFSNSAATGTVLVYFTEMGFAYFSACPVHELFNCSVSLDTIFGKYKVVEVEEKLAAADSDQQRIQLVECFLLAQLKSIQQDKLVIEAIKLIHESNGTIRIKALSKRLAISQSPLEKRFRMLVGTSPKKFASIVRFNAVLAGLSRHQSVLDLCYETNFFDQAHFSHNFKRYTGQSFETFKRLL